MKNDKIDLDILPIKYWSIKTIINYIQRRIIIYSIMYYELNKSVITDKQYDALSQQLIEFMNSTKKEVLEQTEYWYCMYDFDGNTGFDIPNRLNKSDREYLTKLALHILKLYRSENIN